MPELDMTSVFSKDLSAVLAAILFQNGGSVTITRKTIETMPNGQLRLFAETQPTGDVVVTVVEVKLDTESE